METPYVPTNIRPVARRIVIVLMYAAVAAVVMGPVLLHPARLFLGGYGDPQQFMWYLRWFWYAVGHGLNPFHTALLNAPQGQNLMWNTSILALSASFGWMTYLWNATAVYNLLWLLNAVLSCLIGERILVTLGVRQWLAVLGGLLTGMLPYTTAQSLFHIHLWWTSVVLALVWLLVRAAVLGVRRPVVFGAVLGLLGAFQFYTSIEVAATFAFALIVFLMVSLISGGRTSLRLFRVIPLRSLATAVVVVLAAAVPGVYEFLFGPNRPLGSLLPGDVYVNDLYNFILPTKLYALHSAYTQAVSLRYTGNFWENNGYLGIVCLVLLVVAGVHLWRKRAARAASISAVVISVFSMGPSLHIAGVHTHVALPWALVQHIPFMDSALPSRLMLYADVLIVIVLVYFADTTLRQPNGFIPHWFAPIGLVGMMVTWFPATPFPHTPTPAAVHALSKGSAVYAAVNGQPTYVLERDPSAVMQGIAENDFVFPMVNPYGYADNAPGRRQWLDNMRSLMKGSLSDKTARWVLTTQLPGLGATRLLYFPLAPGEALAPRMLRQVEGALGLPAAAADGALVWVVPKR